MNFVSRIIFFTIFFCFFYIEANAYIGPGMSGGALIAVLGFIVAIFAAIFGLIYIPLKRLFKKIISKKKPDNQSPSDKK